MSTINVGEYGLSFNVNANYPLNAATTLTMEFTRPDGTTFSATAPAVTVPASPLVTPDQGTFAAYQYASYGFIAGDLNQAGEYIVRLRYVDATKSLHSDPASFTVNL